MPDLLESPVTHADSMHYPYGVGIDTHKAFIQVCILYNQGQDALRIEREYQTDWPSLLKARQFIVDTLYPLELEKPDVPFRYTIESTGCYHIPVILALKNRPSIINPVLAGPTRRKTDVLDARMLAQQSMLGLWRESYILSEQAETLRCLLSMRNECSRGASRQLNRLNNHALRYGHTLGRDGSMGHQRNRAIIEDMCDGHVPIASTVCPNGLPLDARPLFKAMYEVHDFFRKKAATYDHLTTAYVHKNTWPTDAGLIPGKRLLAHLTTCPGVGPVTALTWLSTVHDPRRFASSAQIAAYCGSDPSVKVSAGKTTSHTKRKGNARLHHALKNCAATLVRSHKEPLGQWGYAILRRHRKASWGRSINAVARRLSICLWQVHRRAVDFSYEQYRFYLAPVVPDIPLEETNILSRYRAMLHDKGLTTTGEVARAFLTTLPQQKGIGPSCLNAVKAWIDENKITPPPQSIQSLGRNGQPSQPPTAIPPSGTASTKPNPASSSEAPSPPATGTSSPVAKRKSRKSSTVS